MADEQRLIAESVAEERFDYPDGSTAFQRRCPKLRQGTSPRTGPLLPGVRRLRLPRPLDTLRRFPVTTFDPAIPRDNKGMDELRCLDDLLKAVQRLMRKHDPSLVLKIAREWLAYMDKAERIMNPSARIDGVDHAEG